MHVPSLFAVLATLIVIGFLSNHFFSRIRIPDSVILILMGVLLGPVTGFFQPSQFLDAAGIMASVAIMVIMFEAGMLLDLNKIIHEAPRGLLYGTMHFAITAVLTTLAASALFGWPPLVSLILGLLLGGTSAAIVIPIVGNLVKDEEEKTILEIESTVTNVYSVIFVFIVAQAILEPVLNISSILNDVFGAFAISIMLGALFGVTWQMVIKKLGNHPFLYTLTLAVLMYLYALCEFIGVNGPLATFVFGITLTNYNIVSPLRTMHLIQLHREISFFIRVFFFVFLGVIFTFTPDPLIWVTALIISFFSMLSRFISCKLLSIEDAKLFTALIPRGLGEAVIVSILLQMGIPHAETILAITSTTIIITNIVTSVLIHYIGSRTDDVSTPQ